jgi:hypothetical protein
MRICHGVAGHTIEVDETQLQWKKPIDLVEQYALERWDMSATDLIALSGGGGVVGPSLSTESLGSDRDVFIFLRSTLDPREEVTAEPLALSDLTAEKNAEAMNAADTEDELLRLRANCSGADPAFEAFRSNIEEAHRWLLESRPVNVLAAQATSRLQVQRQAAQAVLENLASHRTTCSRSMTLFLQKYGKVQERFDQNLANVEPSMNALQLVSLHPAMCAPGRAVLADLVPRDRIKQFATNLQVERKRLAQRVEKLQKQDAFVQNLCEQVKEHMLQFSQEDGVETIASKIRSEHGSAETELLPELRRIVPQEGAAPTRVLEEEKRSAGALEGLARVCGNIRTQRLPELQARWEQRQALFQQRLREVSYVQSKVRDVERQAALLEEEINVQRNYSQKLGHLKKLPKAYQKMLYEVARRRQFRDRYLAEREQARLRLARMAEEENSRRRAFLQRHGCHLPAELAQGLGCLVPPVTLEVAGFDTQLPDVDYKSMFEAGGASASNSMPTDRSHGQCVVSGAAQQGQSLPGRAEAPFGRTSSTSSCGSSSLHQPWAAKGLGSTCSAQLAGGSQGGSSGRAGTGSSGQAASILAASQDGAGTGTGGSSQSLGGTGTAGGTGTGSGADSQVKSGEARSTEELNRELNAQVASLKEELARLHAGQNLSPNAEAPSTPG